MDYLYEHLQGQELNSACFLNRKWKMQNTFISKILAQKHNNLVDRKLVYSCWMHLGASKIELSWAGKCWGQSEDGGWSCKGLQKSRASASENFSLKTTDLLGINKKALVLVATVSLLNLYKCRVLSDGRKLVEMLWGEKNSLWKDVNTAKSRTLLSVLFAWFMLYFQQLIFVQAPSNCSCREVGKKRIIQKNT